MWSAVPHRVYTLLAAEVMEEADMRLSEDSDEELTALPLAPAGSLRPGIVHRLDKGTTGQPNRGEKRIRGA